MIGVAIGSFGMPSAVALNVAAIRHFNKARIPIIVHDDFTQSDRDPEGFLASPNDQFDLIKTDRVHGHIAGDIQCFLAGLKWAKCLGLSYLVKLSQRFIITTPEWCNSTISYAEKEAIVTASQRAASNHLAPWGSVGVRTECVLMQVESWARQDVYDALLGYHATLELSLPGTAEKYVHPGRPIDRWRIFNPDKQKKRKGILWHDANPESEYRQLAAQLGCQFENYTNAGWPAILGHAYKMS